MLSHGLSTGALFFLVGMLYERRHSRRLGDFGGLGRPMPHLGVCLVIISLGAIGLPEAVDLLIEATNDEEWEVRMAAIAGLDAIGDERGKPAIKALMKDPDFAVQMRAERIIWAWKKKDKKAKEEIEETSGTA